MSIALNDENISSINRTSPLKKCEQQTTYKFYESKFHNLIKHIEHIASYAEDVLPWLDSLKLINFDIFLQINDQDVRMRASELTTDEKMAQIADSENFDLNSIKPDDLNKLKRYYELFQSMGI